MSFEADIGYRRGRVRAGCRFIIAALGIAVGWCAQAAEPVSRFGAYEGYSEVKYDGYQRTSEYVTVRDGTRLAIDIYRPTLKGQVATERLPVVWSFTPYNRATRDAEGRITPSNAAQLSLIPYGYIVAIADVRGKGASFGVRKGPADSNEMSDAGDLIDWLAKQPYTNGNIGMMGCSYFGFTALQGAFSGSPHLKAVFVGTTAFDQYGTFAAGGIPSEGLLDDVVPADVVVEVDADKDRKLVLQALKEHEKNTPTGKFFASTPFRDDVNPFTGTRWWEAASVYSNLSKVRPDVGFYIYGGYYDLYADQTVIKYNNLRNPKKLAFGNWPHCEAPGFRLDRERLRFFDYWLKGIQNNVMSEPPVHVYVTRAKDGTEWRSLPEWPKPKSVSRFFLSSAKYSAGPGVARGRESAVAAGMLQTAAPPKGTPPVEIRDLPDVDPLVIYGTARANVDTYSATFTLPPQQVNREIIGSPVARLWISTPATDADIHVYLEAVNRMGGAEIISRGVLRASRRATGEPPYDMGGLPWQTHRRADAKPLKPNEMVALDIALSPTAYTIRPGDLLRLAVTTRPPFGKSDMQPPLVRVHSTDEHPSYIEIPEVDTQALALDPDETEGLLP
jgi:putative CocE/NonD family hydrolase